MTEELKIIIELTSESAARKAADCAVAKVLDRIKETVPKDIELAIHDHQDNCPAVKATTLNMKVVAMVGAACSIISPLLLGIAQWLFSMLRGKAIGQG